MVLTASGRGVAEDVAIDSIASVPDQALVSQPQAGNRGEDLNGTLQSYILPDGTLRGVAQTFEWPSNQALKALGVRVSLAQGGVATSDWRETFRFGEPQEYRIFLFETDDAGGVMRTAIDETVTLGPEVIVPGQHVTFQFDPAVPMWEGRYAFYILPLHRLDEPQQRIFWDMDSDVGGGAYEAGAAQQKKDAAVPSTPFQPGFEGRDLTFFLQAE